ncbi:unnamed protein product [Adineta steineri]|uniref:Beta-lactamase-related domain-containing protein n=2 Tax=Adineta steineri TaxID=433720 RepID=A0A819DM50_9BILA|nr:unnamed protein product [Adineta steineri]CAF3837423.1 unnamed protein product [Adineta steineri]
MCSAVFLADRNEQQIREEDLDMFPMNYATYVVNYNDLSVTASIFGFVKQKAMYRNGLGATLINELTEEQIRGQTFKIPMLSDVNQDNIPWPMGNKIDDDDINNFPLNINQTQIQEAMDNLFLERDLTKLKRTRAVVVLYDGKLIVERYASTFSKNSKFLGWSMTKSTINALIGILVKDKKLNIEDPAPVPEWNNTNDPRHSITLKHLLTQTSGINFNEDYYSKSDVTQMLFSISDMTAFAASHPLKHKPGSKCYYNSGTTNILSRIIRHTVGENEYHIFPHKNLFSKLGMNDFIMEVDTSGTFVGSSYSWGTARDWARLGLLYLNNGFYNNQQILSHDWIKQSTTLTASNEYGEYGFHIWLNTGKNNDSSIRKFPNVPTDMFYFSGFDGQAVFIIPSKKVVVVRLGLTKAPDGNYGADQFLKEIISSIK